MNLSARLSVSIKRYKSALKSNLGGCNIPSIVLDIADSKLLTTGQSYNWM